MIGINLSFPFDVWWWCGGGGSCSNTDRGCNGDTAEMMARNNSEIRGAAICYTRKKHRLKGTAANTGLKGVDETETELGKGSWLESTSSALSMSVAAGGGGRGGSCSDIDRGRNWDIAEMMAEKSSENLGAAICYK
ncbi:hypothetical protein VitviT2T_025773 [Vitis vinifera]|uniref:Uncharacterized protein n=1 Tax=Vitis vinifera TaxID=29760 RepID=A0ABY9DMU4_VITVI|nr:hypothetical protein VitviT2T_025773 [Vitis vinifera]